MPKKKKLKLDAIKVKSFVTLPESQEDKVKGGASLETNCFETCVAVICETNEYSCMGTCYQSCVNCGGGGTRTCYTACGETCDYGFQCLSIKPDLCTQDVFVC